MGLRGGLHKDLCSILSSFGVWLWDPINFENDSLEDAIEKEAKRHVYFQPPENFKIAYPCIVYEQSNIDTRHANNVPYSLTKQYTITVIDKNPDTRIPDKVACLPMCSFDRHFTSDNLHHYVFKIYY
jgi:hypothetical protein